MTSKKQVAANRRNAQKSTGPKTGKGKAVAKYNAIRHGLLAQEAVILGEDESAFNVLYEHLRRDLSPEGEIEFRLVERIATSFWRLRRIGRVEAGIFALQHSKIEAVRAKDEAEKHVKTIDLDDLGGFLSPVITNENLHKKAMLQFEKARNSQQEDLPTMGLTFVVSHPVPWTQVCLMRRA